MLGDLAALIRRWTTLFAMIIVVGIIYPQFGVAGECGLGSTAARPILSGTPTIVSSSNFRVHYTISGVDSSTETLALAVAAYAESIRTTLSTLKWALPPHDFGSGGGNGTDPDQGYDIFIYNIYNPPTSLDYAITREESPYTDSTQPPVYPNGYTSWIGIDNDTINYTPTISYTDRLKALLAHEIHHASQIRYSSYSMSPTPTWFMENCSVYFEDIMYDDVNTLPLRIAEAGQDPLNDPEVRITHYFPSSS